MTEFNQEVIGGVEFNQDEAEAELRQVEQAEEELQAEGQYITQ